jgi:putative PEP-CTERM system TPR-repeat lipoprotein
MARARFLISQKRLDEAEQILTQLQSSHPTYGLAWSLHGDVYAARGDFLKAEEAYGAAMTKRFSSAEDRLKRASVRVELKKLDDAQADAQELTKRFPKLQAAWYLSGFIHLQKNELPAAKEALERSYGLSDDHVPTLILLGWTNLSTGNPDRAVELAERVAAVAPNLIAARELVATVRLLRGDAAKAEEAIRPVVKAQPDNVRAKGLFATSLLRQEKTQEAAQLLDELAAARRDSAVAQVAVGRALVEAKEPAKGLEALERAVELAPDAVAANAALVQAQLDQKLYDDALAAAQRFREKNSTDAAAIRLVASTHAARGDRAKAIEAMRQALAVTPGDARSSIILADWLQAEKQPAEARKVLEESLGAHPDDAGLLTVLAEFARRDGKIDDYKRFLRKAIEKDPGRATPRALLAHQLLAEDDPRGALAVLPTQTAPSDPRLVYERANANFELDQFEFARNDYERLAAAYPKSADVQYRLARVYASLGEQARMESALAAAATLAPDDVGVVHARARALAVSGKLDEAKALLPKLGPDSDPATRATRLFVAQRTGDKAETRRLAESQFKDQPSPKTLLTFVQAQLAAGQREAAEQSLRAWLDGHPDDDAAALALAEVYGATGRSADAAAVLRPVLARHPGNAAVLNNLAWHLRDSSPAEALTFAEKAHAAAPDNVLILDTYAVLLARNGDLERALRTIDRAIQISKDAPYLKLQRIDLLLQSGNRALAAEELASLSAQNLPAALRDRADALRRRSDGLE